MRFTAIFASLLTLIPLVSGVRIPGADTPLFYLVAIGPASSGVNFLPLRTYGSSTPFDLLTGTGPIAKWHFWQGKLVALDPDGNSSAGYRPLINTVQTGTGTCATWGELSTVRGSSSNKCASYDTFAIQSNSENSQLGAKLTFNSRGGFYICGGSAANVVWYKVSPSDGPGGCTPIELYTVPVVE